MRVVRQYAIFVIVAYILCSCGSEGRDTHQTSGKEPYARFDTLDRETFPKFLSVDGIKIVEFGGKHCAPCNRMRERLITLQKEIPDITLGLVFWEDNPELYQDNGVTYIPVQVVYDSRGKEVSRHVGEWEYDEIKKTVTSIKDSIQ